MKGRLSMAKSGSGCVPNRWSASIFADGDSRKIADGPAELPIDPWRCLGRSRGNSFVFSLVV